jgi:hypothetical protein
LCEVKLMEKPKTSCELRREVFVSSLSCAQYSTIESSRLSKRTLVKELRGSDDRGVTVALDGFEVRPVLGYDLGFPPPCADCD